MAPRMWIIAGPNGAGKSTLTNELLNEPAFAAIKRLNADDLTAILRRRSPATPLDEINLRAAKLTDAAVEKCIQDGESFIIETVLSSPKYRDDLKAAKAAGFEIGLIYISLHPPELSPARVSERVLKGGHTVAPMKALERYHRSHKQLAWFATKVDALYLYDNSAVDGSPVLVASREGPDAVLVRHARILNPALSGVIAALKRTR